jgi:hypothetical protein
MMLQAFVDESESPEVFVLAGFIATAEAWAAFSKDWEEVLPLAPLGPDMKRNFKFSEMMYAGHLRQENISAFSRVIENHVALSLSFHFFKRDLRAAMRRIQVPGVTIFWEDYQNPYIFAFLSLMGMFHREKARIDAVLGSDQPIDFIFDERTKEEEKIRTGWKAFVEGFPEDIGSRFSGEGPRFVSDKRFLALQGADFMAGWFRYWLEKGERPVVGESMFAGKLLKERGSLHLEMTMNEDAIVEFFINTIRLNFRSPCYICDIKVSFASA